MSEASLALFIVYGQFAVLVGKITTSLSSSPLTELLHFSYSSALKCVCEIQGAMDDQSLCAQEAEVGQ